MEKRTNLRAREKLEDTNAILGGKRVLHRDFTNPDIKMPIIKITN